MPDCDTVTRMAYRALTQIRENVKALLADRNQEQQALAFALNRHPTTISKFLKGSREVQLADLDAMADFFGVATYTLFQPGISKVTERRRSQRRVGVERRAGLRRAEAPGGGLPSMTTTPPPQVLDPTVTAILEALLAKPHLHAAIARVLKLKLPKVTKQATRA